MSLRDLVFKAAKLGDVEEMERLIVMMGADPDIKAALRLEWKIQLLDHLKELFVQILLHLKALKIYFSLQVRNRQLSSTCVFRFCHHLSIKIIYFSIKCFSMQGPRTQPDSSTCGLIAWPRRSREVSRWKTVHYIARTLSLTRHLLLLLF